jgi:hypothetical protein
MSKNLPENLWRMITGKTGPLNARAMASLRSISKSFPLSNFEKRIISNGKRVSKMTRTNLNRYARGQVPGAPYGLQFAARNEIAHRNKANRH